MRRLRKNTIFRFYLFSLSLAFIIAGFSALAGQRRFYLARLERLDNRLSELAVAVQSATNVVVAVQSSNVLDEPKTVVQERQPDPFWIEGHGFNKRYAYLDICFPDGYRARYYFRPWPSKGELVQLHRQISHDAEIHAFVLDLEDDYG